MRIPLVTFAWVVWLAIVQWTPAGGVLRKANLWCILGIPGVWWIDLQVDGVRRGYVLEIQLRPTWSVANFVQLPQPNSPWTSSWPWNSHCVLVHLATGHPLPCNYLRSRVYFGSSGHPSRPSHFAGSSIGIMFRRTASASPQLRDHRRPNATFRRGEPE